MARALDARIFGRSPPLSLTVKAKELLREQLLREFRSAWAVPCCAGAKLPPLPSASPFSDTPCPSCRRFSDRLQSRRRRDLQPRTCGREPSALRYMFSLVPDQSCFWAWRTLETVVEWGSLRNHNEDCRLLAPSSFSGEREIGLRDWASRPPAIRHRNRREFRSFPRLLCLVPLGAESPPAVPSPSAVKAPCRPWCRHAGQGEFEPDLEFFDFTLGQSSVPMKPSCRSM